MACISIDLIRNCNNCKFEYIDTSILRNTTELNIIRLVSKILWMNGSTEYSVYDEMKHCIIISCTGSISVKINNKVTIMDRTQVMELSYRFLKSWYSINVDNIKEDYSNKVLELIKIMKNTDNIYKIRNESIKLAKYIENAELGNRVSNITYLSPTDIVNTCFKLSSISCLTKFTAPLVIGVLNNVMYHIKDLRLSTLFIDLDMCYVTYRGELSISPNLKLCSCSIKAMKTMYSKYLNAWCKDNFMQCKEIEKIKRNIDISNRSQNLDELYSNCTNLLNSFNY